MNKKSALLYLIMMGLGLVAGLSDFDTIHMIANGISDSFMRIFKCLSTPVIALSLIVTISMHAGQNIGKMWRRTLTYTISTTIIAALVSLGLYRIIQPSNFSETMLASSTVSAQQSYLHYLSQIIPNNLLAPFIENNVMSILIMGIVIGFAIREIPDPKAKQSVQSFFQGMHSMLFVIIKWVIRVLPLGLFGFISVAAHQFKQGANTSSISQYLAVIIGANLIQGFVVLPLWLKWKGINPVKSFKGMLPALSVAFFSKSSTGTLPVTIETSEKRLGVKSEISRFVLPLCTSINMNGCAAFIFTTVIFVMQNNGVQIDLMTMLAWVFIATIAAIGNAGVPMGCFFLSASLLSSMNIPIVLMGIILPFYALIDMVETALNVWSDACVTQVIDHEDREILGDAIPEPSPLI